MAHKKGVGSSDNGRDSKSKRLGVKLFGGQLAKAGNILVRQRGTRFHAGENVYMSNDHSLHAAVAGTVAFKKKQKDRTFVSILPLGGVAEAPAKPAPVAKPAAVAAPVAVEEVSTRGAVAEETAAPAVVEAAAPVAEEVAAPEVIEAAAPEAEETAAPQVEAAEKAAKITLPSGKKISQDDLKVIEGVGPKIEGLLNDGGIFTWADLADAETEKVQAILDEAGPSYRIHDPATWANQAQMAHNGQWEELEAYQERLKGGREEE